MDAKERARQRAEARTASSWYKLQVGTNTFRLLPTPASATTQENFFEYFLHRDVGPRKQTLRCGKDIDGKGKCWICDQYMPKLKSKGQDVRASALASKPVFLVQVAQVADDGKMKGPLLWTPSTKVADQLLASVLGSRKKTYEDPVKGYNLSISRTGTGKNDTRYGIIEPDDEPSKVPSSIISILKPFSDLQEIPIYSEGKQKAAIQGVDAIDELDEDDDEEEEEMVEAEDDDEEEELPIKKAAKPAPKKVAAVEEEEDEDVPTPKTETAKKAAPVVEEEEDDEPAPPPKKPAKKSVVVEEDDDEEEEPVAAAPPKKKSAASGPAAKPVAKKAAPVEEDEDLELDDDDFDLELDEEEEEKPAKKKAK